MRIEKWIEANEHRVDSHELFKKWVEMHSTHNYWREEQASVIVRVLESIPGEHPTIIDLICGAGGLSEFLLKRLPKARVIGVDSNPFLLMIYRNHLAEYREGSPWFRVMSGIEKSYEEQEVLMQPFLSLLFTIFPAKAFSRSIMLSMNPCLRVEYLLLVMSPLCRTPGLKGSIFQTKRKSRSF